MYTFYVVAFTARPLQSIVVEDAGRRVQPPSRLLNLPYIHNNTYDTTSLFLPLKPWQLYVLERGSLWVEIHKIRLTGRFRGVGGEWTIMLDPVALAAATQEVICFCPGWQQVQTIEPSSVRFALQCGKKYTICPACVFFLVSCGAAVSGQCAPKITCPPGPDRGESCREWTVLYPDVFHNHSGNSTKSG